MKFVVSSSALLSHLASINGVISSKNNLPILDNFLFNLSSDLLTITASDLETTLTTTIPLQNAEGSGKLAIDAKRLTDILKEFAEQPLTFQVNDETLAVDIISQNGKFSVVGLNGDDYPHPSELKEDKKSSVTMPAYLFRKGILSTLFATASDELRPVMNGIFVHLTEDCTLFVASDAHKLVRYGRKDVVAEQEAAFILPKKPAQLLRSILGKEENDVRLEFDDKNAFIELSNYTMIARLTEGTYPNYQSVIPVESPKKAIIDRVEFLTTVKRVAIFSNQASNLVKLELRQNELTVSAQDIDFSTSAYEKIVCQYDGDDLDIGFKSSFLLEILQNLPTPEVVFELSDPARAALLLPHNGEDADEDVLMLIMPMMISA